MEDDIVFPPSFPGFGRMVGLKPVSIGDGKCTVEVTVLQSHLNAGSVAHGGLHATLLDTALGGALLSLVTPEDWCATAEIVVSYIRPSKQGTTLVANGRVVKRGKSIA
ncbi:MAG: PaaI family thioesterase, partial [Candidatus Thermoplasmatota archaeon]|nr:PaaI family thioesterase [Candidatus Thermoplasmatota archaeon]